MRRRSLAAGVLAAVFAGSCAAPLGAARSTAHARAIEVVAAENVYGDIAAQLGGRYVRVSSILSSPSADPHLFEPAAVNAAAVARARLVIANGLGYDAFVDRLARASPDGRRRLLRIADALRVTAADANPHLWYDIPRVPAVAGAISGALAKIDPAHRAYFARRLAAFDRSLAPLDSALARIRAAHAGTPVAYTERLPGYLLRAAGLIVRTPASFARALEHGIDPTPRALAVMEALISTRRIQVLVYNRQAASAITQGLRSLARRHGIAVVAMTETLPRRTSFQAWELAQIQALARGLSS